MKKNGFSLLLLIAAMMLSGCSSTNSAAAQPTNNATQASEEVITEDETTPEEEYCPVEIKYQSKEYEYFANGTELRFYFTVTNTSENNIVSPACDIDMLNQQGNILFTCYIRHTGAVKPGQSFDDCAIVNNRDHNWEKREEIYEASVVDYRDDENNCVFNDPIIISLN